MSIGNFNLRRTGASLAGGQGKLILVTLLSSASGLTIGVNYTIKGEKSQNENCWLMPKKYLTSSANFDILCCK
ncbi:hypothetical protein AUJ95_05230 [Candidatus Desantisbacteria bacterium CG2_30_40_21]|uniref:Uncharacterized protein n=4 Tax=unclassified Candidatus Desantisiibacteriota TaxID=3106372 RepID=A0A2M7P2V1_9BACT|nr:MAG: hypothetical protein AUJ95_05230 [Candidatus Desantisbacteria bacterium CG2_30_40_21]PIP42277.1 MAG: hypothetical protein COX18_00780 [Candidatus Desantisbacteria bacterium CG23_combo_of_CG06-09_8_20_14_all_40_23]PIY19628.1 MAG: hypothetical protein COZ13_04345 [Candidatus Desantisbacteria bacterium CG_4_10_14_3_um_filter_40_18]PJB30255.1 MAG: hypothetical protein CO110_01570 [Candidatus Desantisbacteria bacterium CG_4_9_14_3_um_filter_40_11]